jgi:hypothetical protein
VPGLWDGDSFDGQFGQRLELRIGDLAASPAAGEELG